MLDLTKRENKITFICFIVAAAIVALLTIMLGPVMPEAGSYLWWACIAASIVIMYRNDTLDQGGLIAAIVFGPVMLLTFALAYLCGKYISADWIFRGKKHAEKRDPKIDRVPL